MEFFEVIQSRRSIRKYLKDVTVPESVVENALDAALLAPNSSNMQTWQFFWVKTPEKKQKLIEACLNQNAARTAQHLVVVVSNTSGHHWKRNQKEMIRHITKNGIENAHPLVLKYYSTLMPLTYGFHFLAPLKWLLFNAIGLFKPMSRHPWSHRDVQEVGIKSAALACENFMLAVTAQGFDSCPMEGFDEWRVRRIIGLKPFFDFSARVVMVISVGKRDEKGLWGPQLRFDKDWFIQRI